MTQLLTHSRKSCYQECQKKAFFAYELTLRRIDDAKALRMGSAGHDGVEQLGRGLGLAVACQVVRDRYERMPVWADPHEWQMERETLLRLICAYDWRWGPMENVAVELPFELPLINPATGKRTRAWNLGGKIDAIVRLEDGRIAVKETKFLGDDIGPDSDLWRRLRMDQQISLYLHAARRLGHDCKTVLYDVVRKPTIKPNAIPVLDELGAKIVLNQSGTRIKTERGQWRQTGDAEKGYTLQTRLPTAEEWGEKLTADITERPDYYFARVEIPRLDQDLREFEYELWGIQQMIRESQKSGRWFRTVSKNTCTYCPYFNLCSTGTDIKNAAPEGFEFLSDPHPELNRKEKTNGSSRPPETTASATATSSGKPGFNQQSYW